MADLGAYSKHARTLLIASPAFLLVAPSPPPPPSSSSLLLYVSYSVHQRLFFVTVPFLRPSLRPSLPPSITTFYTTEFRF